MTNSEHPHAVEDFALVARATGVRLRDMMQAILRVYEALSAMSQRASEKEGR